MANITAKTLREFLDNHTNILIVAGAEKKMDNLACAYALATVAENKNKNVSVFFGRELPYQLQFLDIKKFLNRTISSDPGKDAVVFIGSTEKNYAGSVIPEHIHSNNILEIAPDTGSSASENLARILKEYDEGCITETVATALLTGVVSHTNNFQNPEIQPQTLFASAYLIAKRARNELIVRHLYKTRSLEMIKLWGSLIANLSYREDSRIGWSFIGFNELQKSRAGKEDIAALINELKNNFGQAEIFVLGVESEKEKVALVHSLDPLVLNKLALRIEAPVKNSSCILRLDQRRDIGSATESAVKEISNILKK